MIEGAEEDQEAIKSDDEGIDMRETGSRAATAATAAAAAAATTAAPDANPATSIRHGAALDRTAPNSEQEGNQDQEANFAATGWSTAIAEAEDGEAISANLVIEVMQQLGIEHLDGGYDPRLDALPAELRNLVLDQLELADEARRRSPSPEAQDRNSDGYMYRQASYAEELMR